MDIVIYGAQAIALGTYNAIRKLYPKKRIICFLVSEIGYNSKTLAGLQVRELAEFVDGKNHIDIDNIEVLIATPENVMAAIEDSLQEAGFTHYTRIDSVYWSKLQEQSLWEDSTFKPLAAFPDGKRMPDIQIFKMVHHKDRQLQTEHEDHDCVTSLQVGTANAPYEIAQLQDNTKDNISERNGNYSELTGLYWMWKNVVQIEKLDNKYVGLSHYRRFLELTDSNMKKMQDNQIDVVLPYPMPYEPDIEAHHQRYLTEQEWSGVLQAINELEPEYAKELGKILKQPYFYNYNIVIAKESVMAEYCSWLFRLLFRIEEINNPEGDKIPNRYIGYIGETLETIYFMYNRDKLKIAHAGCRFLV